MSAQIVSFNCLLKSMTGHLINSSVNSDVLNAVPSECSMLNGLAPGMQKVKKGEFRSITLKADQAYGSYDAKKVILYPRNKMAKNENISSGKTVSILSKTGTTRSYRVVWMEIILWPDRIWSLKSKSPRRAPRLVSKLTEPKI